LPVLNQTGPEFSVGNGELGAVQLRLARIDPQPVLQVGQVRPGRLPLIDCAAQGMQERSLPDGIVVSVLGQQPRRLGALVTDQRPPWPASGVEKFPKPPAVSSSMRCHSAATSSESLTMYGPCGGDTRLRIR
jgi:hypothetical protein